MSRELGILSGAGMGDAFSAMNEKLQRFMNPEAKPGVAAPDSTINWWCWDIDAFKQCHALAFEAAQQQCKVPGIEGTSVYNTCVVKLADDKAKEACGCPATAPSDKMSPDSRARLIAGSLAVLALGLWLYEPKDKR